MNLYLVTRCSDSDFVSSVFLSGQMNTGKVH
jgi:hypothetical protein